MNYIIETPNLISTEDHLLYDDQHLDSLTSQNTSIYLRFWELSKYCVVLGRSNTKETEVYSKKAKEMNLEVLKRSSGGGTVILGPGCLCYSLFIPTIFEPCNSISKTNNYVMTQLRDALIPHNSSIKIQGITDLCIKHKKFSGNAQRRLKNTLLFHGTFLYNFDLEIISKFLRHPSKEPEYRKNRDHANFITNLNIDKSTIIRRISSQLNCIYLNEVS
jgi:lipoate---protein ligase